MLDNLLTVLVEGHVGDNFCAEDNVMKAIRVIGYILLIARVAVPIIIIAMGTLDLYKAVMSGGSDTLVKQGKALLFRVVIGILIFVLPSLINWVITSLSEDPQGNAQCFNCLLDPASCPVGGGGTSTGSEEETTTVPGR